MPGGQVPHWQKLQVGPLSLGSPHGISAPVQAQSKRSGPVKAMHHPFWHPVYTGMADFSYRIKGYAYDDRAPYRYATPLLLEEYGLKFHYDGGYYFRETYDESQRYRISPLDLPEYAAIVRAKVLRDVWTDPGWYMRGLATRGAKILRRTTPLSAAAGPWRASTPLPGWILAPTIIALLVACRRDLLCILLLSVAPSLTALLVYSDLGTTNYSIFHLVAAAVWGELVVEASSRFRRRARREVTAEKP